MRNIITTTMRNINCLKKIAENESNADESTAPDLMTRLADPVAKASALTTAPLAAALDYSAVSTIPKYLRAKNAIRPLNEHPSMSNQPRRLAEQADFLTNAADWYDFISHKGIIGRMVPDPVLDAFVLRYPSVAHRTPRGHYFAADGDKEKGIRYRREAYNIRERIESSNREMRARMNKAQALRGKLKARGALAIGGTLLSLLANNLVFGRDRAEQLPGKSDWDAYQELSRGDD